jgi:hypothetical protein
LFGVGFAESSLLNGISGIRENKVSATFKKLLSGAGLPDLSWHSLPKLEKYTK